MTRIVAPSHSGDSSGIARVKIHFAKLVEVMNVESEVISRSVANIHQTSQNNYLA